MSTWVERIEVRAFARFGPIAGADPSTLAHRAATVMVGAIELLAVVAGVVLMLEADARPAAIAAVASGGLVLIAASKWLELRLSPAEQRRRAGALSVADAVPLTVAMALSGGADSPIRLLLLPMPLALGLVGSGRVVLAGTAALLTGYAALGPPTEMFAILAIELAWATTVGMAISGKRRRSLDRLTAVEDQRRSLGASGGPGRPSDIGPEVRETALGPLQRIRDALATADSAALAGLAVTVADVARQLRSIVVELHVLTARQGGLRGSLEGLAHRRSPTAILSLGTPEHLDEEQIALVTSLAREALRALASTTTRHIALHVTREESSLGIRVQVDPAPTDAAAEARAELFLARAAASGATHTHITGGTAQAIVEENEPTRTPSWVPGRFLQDAHRLILVLRIPSIVAVVAAGAVAGASDVRLYLVGAFMVAWSPIVLRELNAPRGALRHYLLVAAPDVLGILALATLLGDAREALLPMVIAVPPCYGLLLSVRVTSGLVLLLLAGLAVTGYGSTAFVVAFAWAGAIGVLLAAGTAALELGLVRAARSRGALVRVLAREEENERRQVARRLHDETLQLLLAARQDLEEAAAGDDALRGSAEVAIAAAIDSMQTAAGELDVDVSALPGGPEPALRTLAEAQAERGGPLVRFEIDEAAIGHHDGLVVRLAGEFVANAVTHAAADQLLVRVTTDRRRLLLEVRDDGQGIDLARVRDAVDRGHVGLASCRERVQAAGGRMEVAAGPRGGTRVLVTLPVRVSVGFGDHS